MIDSPLSICITGPESCGKSTLADHLSQDLKFKLIPEYAREYLTSKEGSYSSSDVEAIATRESQLILEAHETHTSFIKDTGLEVTKIWHEDKFGSSAFIDNLFGQQRFDVFFLCAPTIPWKADVLRENPHDRERLFDLYETLLKASNCCYKVVDHIDLAERVKFCTQIIKNIGQ